MVEIDTEGCPVRAVVFAGMGEGALGSVSVTPTGDVVIGGSFTHNFEYPGGVSTDNDNLDAVVLKLIP